MKKRPFYVVVGYSKTVTSPSKVVQEDCRGSFCLSLYVDKIDSQFVKELQDEAKTLYGTNHLTILNWIELEAE